MRVLFFTLGYWPEVGGVETLAQELLPQLAAQGVDFLVVAPFSSGCSEELTQVRGIPVRRFELLDDELYADPALLLQARHRLLQVLSDFSPDLVHINGVGRSAILFCLGTRPAKIPTLVSVHGSWNWNQQPNQIVRHLFTSANWITACSRAVLQECRSLVADLEGRSSLLYNAPTPGLELRVPIWPGDPRRQQVVLCVARFRPEKGLDRALLCWPQIRALHPKAQLWLIGDGPEEPYLRELAREQPGVHFLGRLGADQVYECMGQCQVVLIPSRQEGFGMVALEAACCGTPVVASAVGGLVEIVDQGRTGLLVNGDSLQEVAGAVAQLLSRPDEAKDLAQRAHARVQNTFAWSAYCDHHTRLYEKLVRQGVR